MSADTPDRNPFANPEHAQGYDAWYETPLGAAMDRGQKSLVWQLAQPVAGESVLDVGTGTGNYACELAGRGLRVIGRDPSEAMLAVAREKPCDVTWEHGIAEELPHADGQFDLVLSVTALEFMEDPEQAVAEMVRVTRPGGRVPGGRVIIGTLNAASPWGALYAQLAADPASPFYGADLHTPERFMALLSRFGNVRWSSAGFVPPSGKYLAWASILEEWGRRFRKSQGALLVGRITR
jgi:ubiquinone/menaquinone biosynthesis C-methylase UbiE